MSSYIYIYYISICAYVCAYMQIWKHICMCGYVEIHIYILYIYTYKFTHTHIHMYTFGTSPRLLVYCTSCRCNEFDHSGVTRRLSTHVLGPGLDGSSNTLPMASAAIAMDTLAFSAAAILRIGQVVIGTKRLGVPFQHAMTAYSLWC